MWSLYIGMYNSLTFGSCDVASFGPNSQGPQGAQGSQGMQGSQGSQGPPGQDSSGGTGSLSIGLANGPQGTQPALRDVLAFEANDGFTLTETNGSTEIKIGLPNVNQNTVRIEEIESDLYNQPPSVEDPSYVFSTTSITLSWTSGTPSQTQTSIAVAPSNLGAGFDYLPYIADFEFAYLEQNQTQYTSITSSSLTTPISNPYVSWLSYVNNNSPNHLSEIVLDASGSQVTYNLRNPLEINLSQSAIGKSYRFRFAYTNQSAGPKNYVYWPDETTFITFGQYGPANPPATIQFVNPVYDGFGIKGTGSSSGMDASLNIGYGSTALGVEYGVDISGARIPGSLQVGGNQQSPYFTNYATSYINTSYWPGPNAGDTGTFQAFPEHEYVTVDPSTNTFNSYYAANNSADFSGDKVFATTGIGAMTLTPIPKRDEVTNIYNTTLGTQQLIIGNVTGQNFNLTTARERKNNYQETTAYFLDETTGTINIPTLTSQNVLCNYGDSTGATAPSYVTSNSILGSDSSGQDLSKFIHRVSSTSASSTLVAESNYTQGYLSNNVAQSVASPNGELTFSVAQMIDPGNSLATTEGYYLGTTISQFEISGVNLQLIPDICNNGTGNTSSYVPHKIEIQHMLKDSAQNVALTETREADLYIARKPIADIIANRIADASQSQGLSNGSFFGVQLPASADFDFSYTLTQIDEEWAPNNEPAFSSPADKVIGGAYLHYYVGNTPNDIDGEQQLWTTALAPWTSFILPSGTLQYPSSQFNQHNGGYSRQPDPSGASVVGYQRFEIEVHNQNNLLRTPSSSVDSFDNLKWSSKMLWWDYSWTAGGALPSSTTLPNSVLRLSNTVGWKGSLVALNTTTGVSNMPFTEQAPTSTLGTGSARAPYLPKAYSFANQIDSNQAMWTKDAWRGASLPPAKLHLDPYVDYSSNFYLQTVDYSSYSSSGDTSTVNYSSSLFIDYTQQGSSFQNTYSNVKWVVFKLSYISTTAVFPSSWEVEVEDDTGNPLLFAHDYLLFYKENLINSTSRYNVDGTAQGFTPWLDSAVTFSNSTSFTTHAAAQTPISTAGINNGIGSYSASSTSKHIINQNTGNTGTTTSTNGAEFFFCVGLPATLEVGRVTVRAIT
jgi:hypothetical protein